MRPNGAREESHLAGAAQNLRELAKISFARRLAMALGKAPLLSRLHQHLSLPSEGDFFNSIGRKLLITSILCGAATEAWLPPCAARI